MILSKKTHFSRMLEEKSEKISERSLTKRETGVYSTPIAPDDGNVLKAVLKKNLEKNRFLI